MSCLLEMKNLVKLNLICPITGDRHILLVSKEDKIKAENDLTFAVKLLEQMKKAKGIGINTLNSEDSTPGPSAINETKSLDVPNNVKMESNKNIPNNIKMESNKKSDDTEAYTWSNKETLLLLELYRKNEDILLENKMPVHKFWNIISLEFAKKGYDISAKKCNSKMSALKRHYKKIKDNSNATGTSPITWVYYEPVEEIFGKKPWMKPPAIAGSHIQAEKNNVLQNTTNIQHKKRKSKEDIFNEYREEKQLRHKEKMALLRECKELLEHNRKTKDEEHI